MDLKVSGDNALGVGIRTGDKGRMGRLKKG
jgi:hypothetical protein